MSSDRIDPPFSCDVAGCTRPAEWAYIGEGGDLYLCGIHGEDEHGPGWSRIEPPNG